MLVLALAAALSHAPSNAMARLESTIRLFESSRPAIERRVGESQALDIATRLLQDEENAQSPIPRGYAADWNEALDAQNALDIQTVVDLAAGRRRGMDPGESGLYETFVTSSVDGTWLPVSIYVPPKAKRGAPLALMLHGNQQPETNLLGQPYFRRLADRTGTILVAPWARGTYDYQGLAQSDVYDVLRAAQDAFGANEKQTYLVGYSMGGFSLFELGPQFARWSAVMSVCGAMPDRAAAHVAFAWRVTPVYIVTGKRDTVIPAVFPTQTAIELAALNLPASFYEEDSGDHRLRTLVPSLTAAWLDMHAGTVHSGSIPRHSVATLPKSTPLSRDLMKP